MTYILDKDTVIAADLDGTLTLSKSPLDSEMSHILAGWLTENRFAIISGGEYLQFQKQIIERLPENANFENLFLFPTNGAACHQFKNGEWKEVYHETLSEEEREHIFSALKQALVAADFNIEKTYGEQIAFRGGQVTFSALGQQAPLSEKTPWDPDQSKRKLIVSHLEPLLPEFTISIGGTTSIDVTKKGIDKAFAISKMKELLNVDSEHIIFLGDALFPGGNDWPAQNTGVHCIQIQDPEESKKIIAAL